LFNPSPRVGRAVLDEAAERDYLGFVSIEAIQQELRNLPPGERVKLIDFLWESLASPEIQHRERAWAEESERRIDDFEANRLPARDAQEVRVS